MGNDREIIIKISADGTAAIAGIRGVGDATEKLGSTSALDSFKKNWLAVTAGITGAYLAFQQIWGLMDKAAEHAEKMETLDALTRRYGTTAQGLVSVIEQNSHGLIGVGAAANVAADALAKGFSPQQVAQMANIAATMHKTSSEGMSASEAFKSLEGSITAARERGVVKMMGATIDLASSLGKQYEAMSKAEKATAMLNAVSEQASKVQRVLGDDFNSDADKIQRFRAQIEELRLTVGGFFLQLAAGLLATLQSVAAFGTAFARGALAPILVLIQATDYLGITKDRAVDYYRTLEALGNSAQDLAEKANSNFKVMWGEKDKAARGTGEALGGGDDVNVKRAEQLAEVMRKIREAQTLAEASELDKSRILNDVWFSEQVKKLHDLGASDKEYSELVVAYAAKRHADLTSWANKTSDFYLAEQKRLTDEAVKMEQERNDALTRERVLAVETRLKAEAAAGAASQRDPSEMIRHQAAGEREILAIRQQSLLDSITEQTTFEETLSIMWQVRDVQNQIEASKRVEVGELDARRLVVEREITELKKQQRDLVVQIQSAYAQEAANKLGFPELGTAVSTYVSIAGGTDPYRQDFDRWSAIQDEKITRMIELGATEAQLKDEYRAYDLMQEQMAQQQKLAIASATFGMMGALMTSLYNMQGQQGGAAFEMMKAFRIGETLINTYSSAVGAYSALSSIPYVGPALGAAAAAAAIAFGMAQVSAIESMRPGGGGRSASTAGLNVGAPATSPAPAASAAPSSPAINITMVGMWGNVNDAARDILPAIQKAIADGVTG